MNIKPVGLFDKIMNGLKIKNDSATKENTKVADKNLKIYV